jgi:hypothetical protein
VSLNGEPARRARPERKPVKPMDHDVAVSFLVTGTLLIATPAVWAITGEWRWAVAGAALFLISLLYTALLTVQKSDPNA